MLSAYSMKFAALQTNFINEANTLNHDLTAPKDPRIICAKLFLNQSRAFDKTVFFCSFLIYLYCIKKSNHVFKQPIKIFDGSK